MTSRITVNNIESNSGIASIALDTGVTIAEGSGLNVSGVGTFSGNLNVGGVLTYQDVTNVDSVGVVTARTNLFVGAGVSVYGSTGIVSATKYYGDGSTLSNLFSASDNKEENFLYNGHMIVAQRGTSHAINNTNKYTLDRWEGNCTSNDLGRFTVAQNDVTDLDGFKKSLKCTVDATIASLTGTNHQNYVQQIVEAQHISHICNGAKAKPMTLSFWYKSNQTGNKVVWFYTQDIGRHYSALYAPSAADTWTKISIAIPADTSAGAINHDSGAGIFVRFMLDASNSYTGGRPTAWEAIQSNRAQGHTNMCDNANNYQEYTGVKLEEGTIASAFDYKSYGDELSRCQRYYQEIQGSDGTTLSYLRPLGHSGPVVEVIPDFLGPMRANPTVTFTGTIQCRACAQNTTATTITLTGSGFETPSNNVTTGHFWCNAASGTPFTAGYSGRIRSGANGSSVNFSAEL